MQDLIAIVVVAAVVVAFAWSRRPRGGRPGGCGGCSGCSARPGCVTDATADMQQPPRP